MDGAIKSPWLIDSIKLITEDHNICADKAVVLFKMYSDGSPVAKANNLTALSYFRKAAEKVRLWMYLLVLKGMD